MTKILIVDDNEQNLYMLQMLLQGNGYKVALACNGAEALEIARRDPPDMIVAGKMSIGPTKICVSPYKPKPMAAQVKRRASVLRPSSSTSRERFRRPKPAKIPPGTARK